MLTYVCPHTSIYTWQVTFRGDGPLGQMMVIADTKGQVKGKVDNPFADPPLRDDGKLNVGAAVGSGVLAVVRSHPLEPRPYTGMVPLISGEVAEDLANYLVRGGWGVASFLVACTLYDSAIKSCYITQARKHA